MEKNYPILFTFYSSLIKIGAKKEVIRPAIPIASPLIAPSVSPISIAFVVPMTWEEVPIEIPMAISSVILNVLHTMGEITAPIMPVIMIAATVIAGIPPIVLETSIPIGVVIDLGIKESVNSLVRPNSLEI